MSWSRSCTWSSGPWWPKAGAAAPEATPRPQFAGYFIVLMLVENVSYTWIMYEYDYRIREGLLSPALLRPVHPIHSDIADNISSKAITMPFMIGDGASCWP